MRLLIVHPEQATAVTLAERLAALQHTVQSVATPEVALDVAACKEFDVILLSLDLPSGAVELLQMLRDIHPTCEVVVLTRQTSSQSAIAVLHRGAFGLVREPYHWEELEAVLMKAAAFARLSRENADLRAQLGHNPPTDNLAERERRHVAAVLLREQGSKVRAAEALGISRRSLYRLIDKHGLRQPHDTSEAES